MGEEAFYRLSARVLSRSQGHTAVGYAAYLSSEKLRDDRYGVTRNFNKPSQKVRIAGSEIIAPDDAPSWVYDREKLFNHIEAAEKRKDSQLCREVQLSLPKELTHQQKKEAVRRFVREQYVSKGMVADISYHNFKGESRGKGEDNPHAHVLLTMRRIDGDGFAPKKEKSWQPDFGKKGKYVHTKGDALTAEREAWERQLNHSLADAGRSERVDCRSLKDRNIDRLPEPKKGRAHDMEQRPQHRGRTRAGDEWRQVRQINELKAEKEEYQRQIAELEAKQQQARLDIAISHGNQDMTRRQKRRRKEEERRKQEERNRQKRETSARENTASEKPFHSDEREIIRQYLEQQADRERGKPREEESVSGKPTQRGDFDQKVENLKAAMEEFSAEQEKSAQKRKKDDKERQQHRPPPEQECQRRPKR